MFPLVDRRIQSLFPAALACLLVLGATRFVLDSLKCNQSLVYRIYAGSSQDDKPVFVLSQDIFRDGCNVFQGKWVQDNASHPLYTEESCKYLVKQTTCQRNGRPDSYYQSWMWQPDECNLPRFDPLKLLDILRNKRLMFIGDSVQRSQFESMVCMVQSVIPQGKKSFERIPPMKIFKAKEYNASIEYYWAPFIVESISDHATNHTVMKRLVHLDSIAKHGQAWEGAHILVFQSYVWWMHDPLINATCGPEENIKEYKASDAYKLALETWAKWLVQTIVPRKQQVYFMSMSPTHLWSWEWRHGSDGNCFNESLPIKGPYWGTGSNLQIMKILGDVLENTKINVTLLNITQLSEYRKDAHTTIYGERKGKLLTKEQRNNPKLFADCIHWCLPGVPDVWNEILFAYLLKNHRNVL